MPSRRATSRRRWWIRGILILTCTAVSFFHGSNDGQKGMGLIMLILIGTVPTAYALNRALPESQMQQFADDVAGRQRGDRRKGRRLQRPRRSAARGHGLRRHAQDQRGHLSVTGRAGAGHRRAGQRIRLARQDAGRSRRQHPQRHVPRLGSDPLPDEGQGKRPAARTRSTRSTPTRPRSTRRPSSSRSGSRSRWRSRSAWAPWSAGSASSSRSARRSARRT